MFLLELFDPDALSNQLQQAALDYLTPLLNQGVPYVTVNQMIEALRSNDFGIVVTAPMIMNILNPDHVKAVEKIEDGKIYLTDPNETESDREVNADDAQKDQDQVKNMAQQQAQKNVQQQAAPPPAQQPAAPPPPR